MIEKLLCATLLVLLQTSVVSSAEEVLLEDRFSEGLTGESPETVGWQLNTSRGGSEWSLTQEGACRVKHVASPYANDSLRHAVKLPSRYYLQFDARLDAHAGFSLVALAGRGGAAFYGAGKTVMWKVLPNLKQNFGWATVPRAVPRSRARLRT